MAYEGLDRAARNKGPEENQAVVIEGVAFSGASLSDRDEARNITSQRVATEATSAVDKIIPEIQEHITADFTQLRTPGRSLTQSAAMAAILAEREIEQNPAVALVGAEERGPLSRQVKDLAEYAARGLAGAQEEHARRKEEEEQGNAQPLAEKQVLGAGQTLGEEEKLAAAISQPRLNADRAAEFAGLTVPQVQSPEREKFAAEYPQLAQILEAVRKATETAGQPLQERQAISVAARTVPQPETSDQTLRNTLDEALARVITEQPGNPGQDAAGQDFADRVVRIETLYARAKDLTGGRHATEDPEVDLAIKSRMQAIAA